MMQIIVDSKNNNNPGSSNGMKKGITFGAFDLCHAGHVSMLKEAKEQCDYLIVGLQTDPSATDESYRGKKKNKPVLTIQERLAILQGIRYIDEIVLYDSEEDLYEILKTLKPDLRIIGADWMGKKFTGYDLPMEVYYNSRNHGLSTSELRDRVHRAESERRNDIMGEGMLAAQEQQMSAVNSETGSV